MTTTVKETNLEILSNRVKEYNSIPTDKPRVGDYILVGDNFYTRITHEFSDKVQTGGTRGGSYYLGNNGYISYSGGLDSGIDISCLEYTEETRLGCIWFFSDDYHTAHNGVTFEIDFRVYRVKEGSDLSGLYDYNSYLRKLELDKLPKVERYSGNDVLYSKPIPKLSIKSDDINDTALNWIEKNTGLKFEKDIWGTYSVQPTDKEQYLKLLLMYNFETKYYGNDNVMVLKFV